MDTPQPQDSMATAQAQQQMNNQTAINQQQLNMVDQYTPDGSLTYSQVGGWGGGNGSAGGGRTLSPSDFAGVDAFDMIGAANVAQRNGYGGGAGSGGGLPHYAATTSLSAPNQKIYDTNQATKQNIATIGRDQSSRIGDLLGTPFSVDQAIADKIDTLGRTRLDPQFAQNEEALRTRLANSGIRAGTAAFDAEMRDFNSGKNDAYNSLYLNGDQQAFNQSIAQRNQPINEITALMSGSQVSNPTFQNTPQAQVGGVNYTGLVGDQYKAQTAANSAQMGGMFGAIGQGASMALPLMMMSDRRAKYDIERVGTLDNGLPVYSFKYNGSHVPQIGLMADEVERLHPHAVAVGPDGFKRVNYAQAVRA